MAKTIIVLDNQEVTIRRAKVKECKQLISEVKTNLGSLIKNFADDQQWDSIDKTIIDHMDFVIDTIAQFTDLGKESLEDMDALSLIKLVQELLAYNGVNLGKLKKFFLENLFPLIQSVPQVNLADNQRFSTSISSITPS